ncbi:ATP phosphoribosyltransferase regulatory subunit, partial [Pseudomonas quasicaspiana]|nr:ATP phosphoribosyltransferase regulatory subunit [Pseudomonas quasicaspiana]
AHTLRREGPSRLCYAGSVLHAQPRALSSSRSPIQLGAQLNRAARRRQGTRLCMQHATGIAQTARPFTTQGMR